MTSTPAKKAGSLSYDMRGALEAIKAAGHVAHPMRGGWWKDARGKCLTYPAKPGSTDAYFNKPHEVTTMTIYALVDRGFLIKIGSEEPHRSTYVTKEWL